MAAARDGGPSGWLFLLAALALALVLAVLGVLATRRFIGDEVKLAPSVATAAVVGLVLAAALLGGRRGRRDAQDEAEVDGEGTFLIVEPPRRK